MAALDSIPSVVSNSPRVRVGIVTRNRAKILPLAIQSALDQDFPNIEIIVVDDGSTDGTAELEKQFPQVRWRLNREPRGYMEARNYMMSEPGADFFVSLDDDSWFLERDAISIGVKNLQEVGVAAVAYDILDDRNRQQHERTKPHQVHTFIGCGHMVDMKKAKAVGFYLPMPGAYGGEEKDLCLRFLDSGAKVLLLPGVHVWHDKTMDSRDVAGQHESGVCNDLVSTWARCPQVFLPGLILAKPARHLHFAFKFIFSRRDRLNEFERAIRVAGGRMTFVVPALLGIIRAFRLLPQVLSDRHSVSVASWNVFKTLSRNPSSLRPSPDFPLPSIIEAGAGSQDARHHVHAPSLQVGAIIAAYNRKDQTLATIARLKACDPAPAEIWVHVDGGMNHLGAAVREAFPDVQVLVSDQQLGPGGSRNRLLAHCKCPLVASFDDDSFPLDSDYFSRLRFVIARFPEAAVLTGELCTPGMIPRPAIKTGQWTGSFLGGACVYNRLAGDRMPLYIPLPVAYGMEEMDLGIRLCAVGKQILYSPWLRVFHDNDSHLHFAPEVTAASLANQAMFAFLRYPMTAWPLGALQVASRVWWLMSKGRFKGIIRGLLSIPGSIWRHRKDRTPVRLADIRRFFLLRRNTTTFPLDISPSDVPPNAIERPIA